MMGALPGEHARGYSRRLGDSRVRRGPIGDDHRRGPTCTMTEYGYFLSSGEHGSGDLVRFVLTGGGLQGRRLT
jgi:hypothetical protein